MQHISRRYVTTREYDKELLNTKPACCSAWEIWAVNEKNLILACPSVMCRENK